MVIFCTYCSKEKDELIDILPAIHRYRSKRIRKVNEAAKLLKIPMFILSGEYGLISSQVKIPNYDHLLLDREVGSIVKERVVPQLRENNITKIFFFHNSSDPYIKPYIDTISQACKIAKTENIFLDIDIGEIENVATNGYRKIWHSALMSNQKMVREKDISASSFSELFEAHPNDGMVFYERGEAYECLGNLDKAKNDYEKAMLYFPNPKWKRVAYEGLKRIQQTRGALKRSGELDRHWDYFHQVNSYIYISHEIRVFVLSSLERYQEEKRLAIGELRICLEMLICNLSKKFNTIDKNYHRDIGFAKKVKNLKKAGCGDSELCDELNRCWRKMGEIIHPIKYSDVQNIDYEITVEIFLRILAICNRDKLCLLE